MEKLKENNKFPVFVIVLISFYIILFNYFCFRKFFSFSYHDWDLAIYAQFFYNALKGNFFSSLLGTQFFGNHLNIILFLFLPLYAVFSHPVALLFLQSLFLGFAAFPLYMIAKKEIKAAFANLFVFLYLIYPGVNYTNLNEFHPESLFPFLFFCTYYFILRNRTKRTIIFAFLCLMLKENFSLIIAMLGLFCMFSHKKKVGLILLILGLSWFCLSFSIIIPPLNKGIIGYYNIYPYFGNSPPQIIKNIILHPVTVIKILLEPEKLEYLKNLFIPLSFLSLLGFRILFLALPLLLQHLLSIRPMEYNINFYYSAELLPIIFIAAIYGLKCVFKFLNNLYTKNIATILVFCIGLIYSLQIGPLINLVTANKYLNVDYFDIEKMEMLKLIPKQSPTIGTFEFLPYLSSRRELYSFHYVYTGFSILSNIPYKLPGSVEYAILDFNDMMTFRSFYNIHNYVNTQKFLLENNWKVQSYIDTIILLKNEPGFKFELCQQVSNLPKEMNESIIITIDSDIELVIPQINEGHNKGLLNVTFFWRCLNPTSKDINIFLDIVDTNDKLIMRRFRPICYRIFPTNSWQKGQFFKDSIRVAIPPFLSGKHYKLKIGFFDYRNNLICKTSGDVDSLGRLFIAEVK